MIDASRASNNSVRAVCKSTGYMFYNVCQKLCFCVALPSFHWVKRDKNINRNFLFCKKICPCQKPRNYNPSWRGWIYPWKSNTHAHLRQGNPIRIIKSITGYMGRRYASGVNHVSLLIDPWLWHSAHCPVYIIHLLN